MPIEFLNENRFTAVVDGETRTYMVISRGPRENGAERILYMDVDDAMAGRYDAAAGEVVPCGDGFLLRPCAGADDGLESLRSGLMRAMRLGALSPMAFAGAEEASGKDGEDDGSEAEADEAACDSGGEEPWADYDPDADQPPEAENPAEIMSPEERLLRAILGETVSESISDRSADDRLMELLLSIGPEDDAEELP